MKPLPTPHIVVTEQRAPFFVTEEEIAAWLELERSCKYVRETDPNCGPEVEQFQKFCGGQKGDSWCDDFQSWAIYQVWPHFVLRRSASCQQTRIMAATLGWLQHRGTEPRVGDLGLVIDVARDHAHHIFAVSSPMRADKTFNTIEGNTNPAGGSNGYGVFERETRRMGGRTTYEFIRFPRKATQVKHAA